MTELKRISDNPYSKEKSAPPEMNWGVRERCFEEGKQSQLEADQEIVNAREIEWIKALMKEGISVAKPRGLFGVRKRIEEAIAQKIFEEIENSEDFREYGWPIENILQALKRKYGVEVKK